LRGTALRRTKHVPRGQCRCCCKVQYQYSSSNRLEQSIVTVPKSDVDEKGKGGEELVVEAGGC
jgi:hypothetical protein